MDGPDLICPNCRFEASFEEGHRFFHGECPNCKIELVSSEESPAASGGKPGFLSPANTTVPTVSINPNDPIIVAELWLPSHNVEDAQAVRQFINSISLPVCLEYFGQGPRRTMLARGPRSTLQALAGQIASRWARAYLEILDTDPVNPVPATDPNFGNGTKRYEVVIGLAEPSYLPIRVWETFTKGDPVHSLLGATLGLKDEEKVWLQVYAEKAAKPAWMAEIQGRLKMESQRGFVIDGATDMSMGPDSGMASGSSMAGVPPVSTLNIKAGVFFVVLVAFALILAVLGVTENWLLFAGAAIPFIIIFGLFLRFLRPSDDKWARADLKLIRQKVVDEDSLIHTFVRLNVWALDTSRAETIIGRMLSALKMYSVAGGNHFKVLPRAFKDGVSWPAQAATLPDDDWCYLNADELGGLWHPPIVDEQVSPGLIPTRTVEMRAPDPTDVEGIYPIGYYFKPDGCQGNVYISETVMAKSLLTVGKPGAGKSSLLEHLAIANLRAPDRPAMVILDPHGDMADRLLGALNPDEIGRVRVFDVSDKDYVFTYNPLDIKANKWDVDQIAQIIIDIGASLWSDYWGPRMQVPLKRVVTLIAAANANRNPGDALGLSLINEMLLAAKEPRKRFIENQLDGSPFQSISNRYFSGEYEKMSQSLRDQIIAPVLSKASRFQNPLLAIFSSPGSKMDLTQIIKERQCLIVNTRMSSIGSELSGFVGSMIINLLIREVFRQGEIDTGNRTPVAFIIDEFQTFPGVKWQELIAQLRKFGGRTVLGTQSLASLRTQDKELVGQILAGIYPLFVFNVNGEDAKYLAENEFGAKNGGPSADTLSNLDSYSAYVRLLRKDGRMTRPFYFKSREPIATDPTIKNLVLEARKEYSAPYEETLRDADKMLKELDKYGGNVLSGGVTSTSGNSSSIPTRQIADAAKILRGNSSLPSGDEGVPDATSLWTSLDDLGSSGDMVNNLSPNPGGANSKTKPNNVNPEAAFSNAVESEIDKIFGDSLDGINLDD